MRRFVRFLSLLLFAALANAQTVERAYAGADGPVHIAFRNGTEFVAPREARLKSQRLGDSGDEQEAADQIQVAPDGRTVAWLALFPNCCTSYPIPLTLVVFRDGRIVQRFGGAKPIFRFAFLRSGREVAWYEDVLHGGEASHCELRDVRSGRLLAVREIGDKGPTPVWARALKNDCDWESR